MAGGRAKKFPIGVESLFLTKLCDSQTSFHSSKQQIDPVILLAYPLFGGIIAGFNFIRERRLVNQFKKPIHGSFTIQTTMGPMPIVKMLPFLESIY